MFCDKRISVFGRFLRKTKLDELPQIFNILKGDMSFVGPRPDVAGYADKLVGNDASLLSVPPGVTSVASLFYIDEEFILSDQIDPGFYYHSVIWPAKVRLNLDYYRNWVLTKDFMLIIKTVYILLSRIFR
ncbi:bacterial sugar transferase family protein [Synechococcus sp. NOUM97013]|nr:bacterial sugar transferase family protein [Synechococcus sp. NOUM97013]